MYAKYERGSLAKYISSVKCTFTILCNLVYSEEIFFSFSGLQYGLHFVKLLESIFGQNLFLASMDILIFLNLAAII